MSMAREEVIKRLKELKARCERLSVSSNYTPQKWREDAGAVRMALSALLPVSREQVEKVWRGEWESTGAISCQCSKCKYLESKTRAKEYSYCPHCGAPLTDDAVDMVMERLEVLKDGNTTD